MPLKINLKAVLIYAVFGAAMVFANGAVNGVPLALGIMSAMLLCGMNPIASPLLYALASIVNLNLLTSLISIFQAVFCGLVVFLYRRARKKIRFEAIVYVLILLAPYVAFAPPINGDFIIENQYILRTVAAVITVAFAVFCFKSVYAVLFRLERCRLKEDELVCLAVTFAVCGAGVIAIVGNTVYTCIFAGITVFAIRLTRSPAAIITALIAAIPCACISLDLTPVTAYVIICVAALIFAGAGRFASGTVAAACTALYLYLTNAFDCPAPLIVTYALILFFACLLPSLPRDRAMYNLKQRLTVTKDLTETAVTRSRRRTSERLYRISEVFREIECAFLKLDENINDDGARDKMLEQLKEKCCKNCERVKRCERTSVYNGFKRLIDAGSMKGKVNLIDLPSEMTTNCSRPSEVLTKLNGLLAEYRRYMTESENARSGRIMLARQARGIAEVMKGCAVDLNKVYNYGGAANEVKKALSAHGICCPEVYIDGENGGELCATVIGKINLDAFEKILSKTLNRTYLLKDKIVYDDKKSCLIFSAPPRLDAAFGVAYAIKSGEKVSGDTHSVIRINEHSFLMVLSDGMGSGEFARKVSEAAISLIEAFYRAEMPEDNILDTITKLLSFNRDERFTCIDIAEINLDTGRADFIKIGSPAGIILREGEIKILESNSLPLGILENLHPTVRTDRLQDGDMVVFMSDGITSAFPSATDLYEFLNEFKPLNPQNLADCILAGALDKTGHKVTDDMTVLCTRIFAN
ncbi:MAG: SpoIIE family protein phosphatase [Clostridia bacterium]|nr:SpoIIE family protein phosphatase [Clostridia bacterium]